MDEADIPTDATPRAQPLSRAFSAVIDDVSTSRRTVTARINTSTVDRYRTVVPSAGGDFRNFMRSPAVLWEHGQDPTRGRQPIGHASSVKFRKADNDLLAVTQFKQDEYSERILQDYKDGVLTAFSIDFIPDDRSSGPPTPVELRTDPSWSQAHTIYRQWELTGYSAVSYPGNPDALALAVERGLWVPDEVRALLPARTVAPSPAHAGDGVTESQTVDPEPSPHPGGDGSPLVELPTVKAYTQAEISRAIGQVLYPVALALIDKRLRDRDDIARGRV